MTVSTIKASGGDYSTLTAWEAAAPGTLTSPWEADCDNFSLTDDFGISGITTSATNYIRIFTQTANRHDGRSRAVSGTGFRLSCAGNNRAAIRIAANHFRLEGIEVECTSTVSAAAIACNGPFAAGANDVRLTDSILHDVTTGVQYSIGATQANLILTMTNCIVYGYQRSMDLRNSATVLLQNCVIWRHADQIGILGFGGLTTRNCYSGKSTGTNNDWWTSGTPPSGNNNVSSDTTAVTVYPTSSINSISGSSVFVSVTPGAEDFRLKSGTNALVDAGASSGAPSTDIVGTARDATPDIGAFERFVAARASSFGAIYG